MANTPTVAAGLDVEGLTESLRALNKVSKEVGQEARGLLREGAKHIQKKSQSRAGGRPGGGTYPRRKGAIRYSATTRGAGIKLAGDRYPWIFGAEFGARRAWVFGRVTTQGRLRRRQFPVWRGNQFVTRGVGGPGWIVQPTIRRELPDVLEKIADGLDELIDDEFTRAGVPRARRGGGF